MATAYDLLTLNIGPCEYDNANAQCAAGPRDFCTHHKTPNQLGDLLAARADVLNLLIAADSLISLVRYRESPTPQTKADADALIPRLRRAATGRA